MKEKYGIIVDPKYTEGCNSTEEWTDDWIECMARLHTDAQNHQLGTAAMGMVIDPELRVYNVSGKWEMFNIFDKSIVIHFINTNALFIRAK